MAKTLAAQHLAVPVVVGSELYSWRATFSNMERSPTSATGTGWERTPWHATQRAAWEALYLGRAGRESPPLTPGGMAKHAADPRNLKWQHRLYTLSLFAVVSKRQEVPLTTEGAR